MSAIAKSAGLSDWITLSRMAEAFEFGNAQLPVPGWLVYVITRIQDFAFSIAGVIMIAYLYGREGLRTLGARLTKWRVHWKWYLFALLPVGLYLLATAISGTIGSFTFGHALSRVSKFGGDLRDNIPRSGGNGLGAGLQPRATCDRHRRRRDLAACQGTGGNASRPSCRSLVVILKNLAGSHQG